MAENMPEKLKPHEVFVLGELLMWSAQLLGHAEAAIGSYSTPNSREPYREWFHESEHEAVACLGVRMALGMPIPDDMADIAEALVAAHRITLEHETNDEAAPLPEASRAVPPSTGEDDG